MGRSRSCLSAHGHVGRRALGPRGAAVVALATLTLVVAVPAGALAPLKKPGAPTAVHATGVVSGVAVSWTPPVADGGTAITGYTVTASPGAETCTTTGATLCTVMGLTPAHSYLLWVQASNSVGLGRPSGRAKAIPAQSPVVSSDNAYLFLDQMMDQYATGSTLRLVQSFTGGVLQQRRFTDSVTYDDALVIDALLARGTGDDFARAQVLGDALLYVQANDPAHDGRIRAAYAPDVLTSPGAVTASDPTSDVGNMAWVGQALVQLYAGTGDSSYLAGATEIADWIQANAYDARGAGGYTGGMNGDGTTILWKSTEHNVDVYAFFTMLATETGDPAWAIRADWAKRLVDAMWSPAQGMFDVGTLDDGVTVNDQDQPEDVNSWSYLALADPAHASSIDWDIANLAVTVKGFTGVSVCLGARTGIWYEGSAHLAAALEARNGPGDRAQADSFLGALSYAQLEGKGADGMGIIAASRNGLGDCDGGSYFASLHTGATAWYLLAMMGANPFHLLG